MELHPAARVAHANLPCAAIIERHVTTHAQAMLLWPNFSSRIGLPGSIMREDNSTRDERFSCRKGI
jgi:hypothetical protein